MAESDIIYYFLNDRNQIGKIENFVPYLYDEDDGWTVDNNHLLMDRLIGYDGDRIGSSDMLFRIDEITEGEAEARVNNKLKG